MTHIRYVGAEPSTEAFGKTFLASEWTDETDLTADAVAILRTNPQFAVIEGKTPVELPSLEVGRDETAKPSGVGESAEALDASAAA